MKEATAETLHKKIAIYLPSLGGGGAERVTVTLANAFVGCGIDVDLVLASATGPYLAHVDEGVRVVDLHASRVLLSGPRLVTYLKNERPAALLSVLNHANVIAVASRAIARVPTRLVVSEHNNLSSAVGGSLGMRARLEVAAMKCTYPWADAVVGVSDGVCDDLARSINMVRNRITTVYNPIDAIKIREKSQESVTHPWFQPGQPPVIVGVGRLTRQKNFALLLDTFARVRSMRSDNVRLVIFGEGELRGELEAQVEALGLHDSVLLPGFVSNPYAYMRAAELFVLSSSWEGLPTVLIEAMASGVKVVSTDCPSGPAEILEDGKWGGLVPVNDMGGLVQAINTALDNESPPSVFSRALDFSVEQSVQDYLRLLHMNPCGFSDSKLQSHR